jgi:virginiamycin B lyase
MIAALVLAATVAAQPVVTTWEVPQKQIPTEIVRHGDALWFVSWKDWPKVHANLGRIDSKGNFTMKDVPEGSMPGLTTHAPDGTLWLSDARQSVFWRVSREGKVSQVKTSVPTQGIAWGPDGHLWSTHRGSAAIRRYATDGSEKGKWEVAAAAAPSADKPARPAQPLWIVAASDSALWFTEASGRRVGRIATTGEMRMYALPPTFGSPGQIVPGRDGALWFSAANILGRITTKGEITTVRTGIPAVWLAADSKGRIWYTNGTHAGYIDRDGKSREFEVKGAKNIRAMAEGPDGAMWFADQGALTIGRIAP